MPSVFRSRSLHRRRYGPLSDKGLEPGGHRELTEDEVESLRRAGEQVIETLGDEAEGEPVYLSAVKDSLETEPAIIVTVSDRPDPLPEPDTSQADSSAFTEGLAGPESA